MSNIIFSLNAVMPIFLMICLGYILKAKNFIKDEFIKNANKLVFKITLPCMLFEDVYNSDFKSLFNPDLMAFVIGGTLICFVIVWLGVSIFVKDKTTHGAFIQGAFRGNFAILGLPILINVFGEEVGSKTSVVLAFVVLIYNVLSVFALLFCTTADKSQDDMKLGKRMKKALLGVCKNPLIIAIVLGFFASVLELKLPTLATKSVNYLGDVTTGLSLIVIGGSFNLGKVKARLLYAVCASAIKTCLWAIIFIPIAVAMGFRGQELGIIGVLFSTPTAVSSYIMAVETGNDGDLAAGVIVISTLLSVFSIFMVIFVLKSFGLLGI